MPRLQACLSVTKDQEAVTWGPAPSWPRHGHRLARRLLGQPEWEAYTWTMALGRNYLRRSQKRQAYLRSLSVSRNCFQCKQFNCKQFHCKHLMSSPPLWNICC